ncbi:MAG: [NiFe]-hydrogenase assembly chaperone HybE [Pseudomonadota bacterium]
MSGLAFEGSYLGDAARLADDAKLECGICWHVYDPAEGDGVWQVPPGTPFSALPDHWRCPECDAEPSTFMVLSAGAAPSAGHHPVAPTVDASVAALVDAYREAGARMRDLPVHHAGLEVEAVGFRQVGDALIGVMVTPWCMNLVRMAEDVRSRAEGTSREHDLPAGRFTFTTGKLDGVGMVELCSLFSPMAEFADQEAASAVARESLTIVLRPPARGRRAFLTGDDHER